MENSTRTEIQRIQRRIVQGYQTLQICEAGWYTEVAKRERRILDRLEHKLSDLMFEGVGRN